MSKILIVDDEDQIRQLLARIIGLEGYEVFQAANCSSALAQLISSQPDVVLCDVFLPDGNGVDFVSKIKATQPNVEVILLTAHGNIADGVRAIKNGAFDYLVKGDDNNKIIPILSRAIAKTKNVPKTALGCMKYSFDSIIGKSKAIKETILLAQKVSKTAVPVLLTGETGTGKEVFAQAIHNNSVRAKANFMALNCSSFSKELLESELFGYRTGAFTGALKDKKGLFEEADGGTLFLDEIGEMAFELQSKLLRVLETGEYIKIGDTKSTKIDVRIIAATNRNLLKEIEKDRFRRDLYYRLSVFQITLPALKERKEDIVLLAESFIATFSDKLGMQSKAISKEYLNTLQSYSWNGNIRELRNVIERSVIVSNNESLQIEDLPVDIQHIHYEESENASPSDFEMSTMERNHISKVLKYTKGNKTEAARLLKIGLTTLYRKLEEYHIG